MQLTHIENEKRKNNDLQKKIVNVASVPKRSPFRYAGGKTWFVPTLRAWLLNKKKPVDVLVEPFAGGGIVGLTAAFENLAKKVVMVELDEDVAAVWETIIDGDHEWLAREILNFDFNHKNVEKIVTEKPKSVASHAFQTILRNRVLHGGILAPGSGLIKNGENGKGLSSRWYPETLAKRILEIGTIREKLSFVHGSAFDVLPDYLDDKNAAIFVDPPYTAAGKKAGRRLYRYHQLDHEQLFQLFTKAKADFLFTYDDSEDLRKLAKKQGFEFALIPMKNTHHATMSELIIAKDLGWLRA